MFNDKFKELGKKCLERTQEEIALMHQVISRARNGDATALSDAGVIAHRVCGGCAMLGFLDLSKVAGRLETTFKELGPAPDAEGWSVIDILMQQFESALQDAQSNQI